MPSNKKVHSVYQYTDYSLNRSVKGHVNPTHFKGTLTSFKLWIIYEN